MQKLEPFYIAGGNVNVKVLWKSKWCFLQKTKYRITIWFNNFTKEYRLKELKAMI